MKESNDSKKHHYVPQQLLRNFYSQKIYKKGEEEFFVHFFDKQNEQSKEINVKHILHENGFNTFSIEIENKEFEVNYENHFHAVEAAGKYSIDKLLKAKDLKKLDKQDHINIASFLILQSLRTKQYRNFLNKQDEAIYNLVKQFPNSNDEDFMESNGKKIKIKELKRDSDQIKRTVFSILRNPELLMEMLNHLLIKKWRLFETNEKNPFYISDSPFVIHNEKTYGNLHTSLGIDAPGVQIYFPISKTLTLHLVCPLYYIDLKTSIEKARNVQDMLKSTKVLGRNPNIKKIDLDLAILEKSIKPSEIYLNNFDSGLPGKCSENEVDFLNYLQVRNAERFIVSSNENFKLAKKMIKDNSHFKKSPLDYLVKFT